jgi:Transposase, Mutator family
VVSGQRGRGVLDAGPHRPQATPCSGHPDLLRRRRLKGFPEAIEAVFPQTTVQTCIVHLIHPRSWPMNRSPSRHLHHQRDRGLKPRVAQGRQDKGQLPVRGRCPQTAVLSDPERWPPVDEHQGAGAKRCLRSRSSSETDCQTDHQSPPTQKVGRSPVGPGLPLRECRRRARGGFSRAPAVVLS